MQYANELNTLYIIQVVGVATIMFWEIPFCKCIFYLISPTNQLYIPKDWGVQSDKLEFHEFHRLILLYFCYSPSKIAMIHCFVVW